MQREATFEENFDQLIEEGMVTKPQDGGLLDDVFLLFEGGDMEAADMVQP